MAMIAALVLLTACLTAASANPSYRSPNCRRCNSLEECYVAPGGRCEFGEYKDNCGFVNCFRGPGENCSGVKRCVGGLNCLCGKCTGCLIESDSPGCYIHATACSTSVY